MSVLAAGGAALTRLHFLADDTDVGDETHKAGPIAVVVIVVLCIACFVLFRSMTKHMRRVREEFPADEPPAAEVPADPSVVEEPVDGDARAATTRSAPKSRSHTSDA